MTETHRVPLASAARRAVGTASLTLAAVAWACSSPRARAIVDASGEAGGSIDSAVDVSHDSLGPPDGGAVGFDSTVPVEAGNDAPIDQVATEADVGPDATIDGTFDAGTG